MIYTVGTIEAYDTNLAVATARGVPLLKTGKTERYAGGYACRTAEDAERLIAEKGMAGVWGIYAVAADWEEDTAPSDNGWWHALLRDAAILHRVTILRPVAGVGT